MKIAYKHDVRNQSPREGGRPHFAVLHTTQGSDHPEGNPPEDLVGIGALFDQPSENASADYCVNVEGKIAQYVLNDHMKAWAVCNFNSMAISLEQIGFAEFSRKEWFNRHDQLKGTAEWLQFIHEKYEIPLRHGWVKGGVILRTGVVQHKDLGIEGCGHVDCGSGYPEKYVLLLARYYVAWHRNPNGKTALKLRKKVNKWRRKYEIQEIK